MRMMPELRIYA